MSSQVSTTKKLLSASALMASGTLISRILGFVRVAMIAFILGNATRQADMLNIATSVPNSLYILFAGGALNTVLVPQIVRAIKNDNDGGDAYTNRIMTAFLLILALVAVLVTVGAPVVTWIYSGEPWHTPALALQYGSMVALAYLTLPQIFFYGVFFLLGQVLNARDRFGPMMWAPIANNIIAIGVLGAYLVIWGTTDDHSGAFTSGQIWLLGIGTTVGIAAQSAVLIPYLRKVGFRFRPRFDLKGTGLGKTFSLTKWTIGFVAVNQLALVVTTKLNTSATALAADGGAGLAVYANAHLVWILPHSLITVSLATAMLPNASRLAAAGDMTAVAAEATKTMRLSLVALVPAAIGFMALASPIAALLFGNGSGAQDSQFVAVALAAFAVGLIPFTVQFVCLRTYYALENTRTPFFLQCVIAAVNVGAALLFVWWVGEPTFFAAAVALAYSSAYVVGVLLSWQYLKRSVPALDGRALALHIVRLALGAGLGGGVAYFAANGIVDVFPDSKLGQLLAVLAGLAIIGVVYVVVGKLLRVRELGSLTELVRTRLGRRRGGDAVAAGADEDVTATQPAASSGALAEDLMPTQPQGVVQLTDDPEEAPVDANDPESVVETRIMPAVVVEDTAVTDDTPDDDGVEPDDADRAVASLGEAGELLSTRYRLEEPLVRRNGIESWRAHDLQLSRDVLAHIMPAGDARIPHVLDAARTGASATDSRFLRVLDAVAVTDDNPVGGYVICEYAPGTALSQLLETQPLSATEAAWIVRELADALSAMHAQGLFHEQLTPDNVILTPSGAIRVVGFGVESVLSEAERPTSWSGKESADVTALAALLYAMLCQHWPGGAAWGLPAAPIVAGALVGPHRLRAAVPPKLDAVCMAVLSDRATTGDARITTASQLVAGLSSVVGNVDPSPGLEERIRHGASEPEPEHPGNTSPLVVGTIPSHHEHPLQPAGTMDATQEFQMIDEGDGQRETVGSPTRRRPILWTIIILAITALVVTFVAITNNRGDQDEAGPEASDTTTTQRNAAGGVAIVSGVDFDPEADGGNAEENPAQVKYAFDDDPTSGWSTVEYHNRPDLGGLKPGVGIVLDLGEVHDISSVDVQFAQPGTDVELRVPTDDSVNAAPMTTQAEWTVVDSQDGAGASTTLKPDQATSSRFLLVYLTKLPEVTTARYVSEITNVMVNG